jgi:hypothetical protein
VTGAAQLVIDAHGIGGQKDLPISLGLAIAGAVAALVISFTVLVVAWRTPRYATGLEEDTGVRTDPARPGLPAPRWLDRAVRSPYWSAGLRVVGMVGFLFTAATAVFGMDQLTNPFFGIVYVWLWVGVIFASVLLGPVWRAINPMRTINLGLARLSGGDPDRGIARYPVWLGHWPAALGLYAFVWMELVHDHPTDLGTVRLWFAVYVAVMLIGGAVFGSTFYEQADPFEVYSTLAGRLSIWWYDEGEDRLALRSPLANLAMVPSRPGLVAVVAVLFGSTGFDSFRESAGWIRTVQNAEVTGFTLNNLALLGFCVGAGVIFSVGAALTGVGPDRSRRELPRRLAHSIVPIIVAYIVAHYLTLFVDAGTQTLARVSDPFGRGWDLFGIAALQPSYWFSFHPTVLANIKVFAVVTGHVTAAVSAHDRAIALLPRRHQITGQLPLLAAMVAFTAGGLYLLFNA